MSEQMIHVKSDFRHRVVNSTLWSFGMKSCDTLIHLLQTVLLARFLTPKDFGLFAFVGITSGIVKTFSNLGLKQALVQKKGDVYDYLNTLWTVKILRGLFVSVIVALVSGSVASFFGEPSAAKYILVHSITIFIGSLSNPAIILFQKEINFRMLFWLDLSATIVSLVVGVSIAYILRNPWALVLAIMASTIVKCITSFILHPYRPRLELNRVYFKEMFAYGKWLTGASILKYFIQTIPDIVIGKMLNSSALGLFQMARKFGRMANAEVYNVVGRVLFPAFCELQSNQKQFKKSYLKSQRLISFIVLPATGLMFILAERVVNVFLGDKWLVIVPSLQAFTLMGCMQSIGAFAQILKVTKPQIVTWSSTIRFSVLVLCVYPMIVSWGILGGVLSIITASSISYAFAMKYGLRAVGCSYNEFIAEIFPNFAVAILTTFLVYQVEGLAPSGVLGLSFLVVLGVTTYILGSLILDWMSGKTLVFHLKTIKSVLR